MQQNIDIKKFLVKLDKPSLTFSININFQIAKLFGEDLNIINFENFIPAPFEFARFLFLFHIKIDKQFLEKQQIVLISDYIHSKDYIIELYLSFSLKDMNTATFGIEDFKVYKISDNLQVLEVFQQLLKQDKNLLKEYNMGNRILKLNDPVEDITKIFKIHDAEIVVNNKYINQIAFPIGRNLFKNPINININLQKIIYIYARNCHVITTTYNKMYSNETNLIGFIFIDNIFESDVFNIIPKELAKFKVDYNAYLEFLDENNEYVNINKIILFYKLS